MNDDFSFPALRDGIHPDVVGEVTKYRAMGRPWTDIRELRKGVDDPEGHRCIGSMGTFDQRCDLPVEGVQYDTAFGDPVFYCEKHALLQHEWDQNLYNSKPVPKHVVTEEWQAEVDRILAKMNRKKKEREEPEDVDPTA